jgi:hypothetical protein
LRFFFDRFERPPGPFDASSCCGAGISSTGSTTGFAIFLRARVPLPVGLF